MIQINARFVGILAMIVLSLFCALSSTADEQSDRTREEAKEHEWRGRQQRYQLLDQEKALLKQSDELSYQVFDYKRTIDELSKKLSATQSNLDDVHRRLITVRMKLMQ